jgi:hypothetical protein
MTLVEVVIATLVLSMILLGLVTSLRTFSDSYTSLSAVHQRASVRSETASFLRHSLREAIYSGASSFRVERSELVWKAPLDRLGAAGGILWLKLARQGDVLTLDFARHQLDKGADSDSEREPGWGQMIPPQTLLEDVKGFSVSVRLNSDEDWRRTLDEQLAYLPQAVMLEWEFSDGAWPPLVVGLENHLEVNR